MRKSGFWKTDWFLGLVVSAVTLVTAYATPFLDLQYTGETTLAPATDRLLQAHSSIPPEWGIWASRGAFALVALYLMTLLPRLPAGVGAVATALILIALMVGRVLGIQWALSATLLLVGHLLLTIKRVLLARNSKAKPEADPAESKRMLGLAFQGQGRLDRAFDTFCTCPFDDGLMENLYNLALDFERKRQFKQATAVYLYMAAHHPTFRDLEQRINRTKVVPGAFSTDGERINKPMIGRYRIEKELGKGAMGVVYRARDTKLDRVVAIKTLALSQEFEEGELADIKQRFFREAETAGRLKHPNIVAMYAAGEQHDVAYVAMEFIKGGDLVPFTTPGQLLPLPQVVSILARVADALAYAHGKNVVHRDVKPANVMYESESDQVKVTDFGIARITDASKTKTGMVLGTPSYMSPEQLSGKKVDGRSDLFSLGVTLYQMACGRLPFVGDSMGQLMLKITSEAVPDIRVVNPQVPDELAAVIDRALIKVMTQRYQTADEMARDLRACLHRMPALHPDVDIQL